MSKVKMRKRAFFFYLLGLLGGLRDFVYIKYLVPVTKQSQYAFIISSILLQNIK